MVHRRITSAILILALLPALLCGRAVCAQDALQQIRARGELIIATDGTYPPFEYKDDQGKLVGFDVDLGNEIGKRLGVKVRWDSLDWTAVLGSLESRKADLIISGMTITEERKQKGYAFTRPYFLSGQSIARRADDNSIQGLADLKTKTVAVQDETTGMYAVQKSGVPDSHIKKFKALNESLLDVRNHNADAAVADTPALQRIIRMSYPDMKLLGGSIQDEYLGIAARHGEEELVRALNEALDSILADGHYASIYRTWIQEPFTTHMIGKLDSVRNEGTLVIDAPLPTSKPETVAENTRKAAPSTANPGVVIRWKLLFDTLPRLRDAAGITLVVTVFTLLFGVSGGLLVALARLSRFAPLRAVMIFYVEILRGTPLLMQIYAIYFILPAFGLSLQPMQAGILALSLNAAAYISEIFRAGIESIDSGQMEAARALGLDYGRAMRWVILPQTLRRVLPPLTNEAVALLKDSSLVSILGVAELMRVGQDAAANTASPTTMFLAVALIYLVMTLPLTWLVRRLETRWQPISGPRERTGSKRKAVAS